MTTGNEWKRWKILLVTEMMYCWWRCKTLLNRVQNEEIRQIMGVEYDVRDTIRKIHLKWYGQICRMKEERIPLKV